MSSPGEPFAYPKAIEEQPPNYEALGPHRTTDPPQQEQPQAYPGSNSKGVLPYVAQIPRVPHGLEYLIQVNQIIIQQKYFTTQTGKTYEILNTMGQRIFLGTQEIKCCVSQFDVKIMDNSNMEVIQLLEPCKCTCTHEAEIHSPPGTIIGYITLNWNTNVTSLSISNASKDIVLLIVGPSFRTNIFGDVNFEVKSLDETQTIGQISRDNEQYVVQFPLDLDAKIKVVLLGSAIFLDYMISASREQLLRRSND
uniref:Phospholipid scramblase n=1 Tax=Geotrypetes seraphini TaxID=260995 RepID=A0A6P8PIL3_GEOSA|nr:phospholipid scramblase 2-like [Geotrypetes seraphini]XP_033781274.1 phospholipid scramblase 2-like [Geotrypetes seraphini]XP_033781275.1 phospholipid scramblase 2-like [Geotrypetes seraphini]XP_033781276.1 phospholipid scramblase 2-like [Geotrypetes seraphini]